jgi:outer membrane usher protein
VASLTEWKDGELALLTIQLNGTPRAGFAYVIRDARDGLLVDRTTLDRLTIPYNAALSRDIDGRSYIPLSKVDGVSFSISDTEQQLHLQTDPRVLAASTVPFQTYSTPAPQTPAWGGFVNYGLFANTTVGRNGSGFSSDDLSGAVTASVFGPYGIGIASALANPASDSSSDLILLDANWRWDDIARMRSLVIGDAISAPGWWGRPVRFGGLQYSTNFALQPGFISYPLMAVSGLATVPSAADIYINNVRVGEQSVPAGPFTLTNIPTMTGAGQLQLVVRDALGREQVISQPYYVANQLLRAGVTEFSLNAGAERFNYGLKNLDYEGGFASAWWRQGLSDQLTAELRAEADDNVTGAGAGVGYLLGNVGVISAGVAVSQTDRGSGQRTLLGFDRETPVFSFGARGTWASRNYEEIGDEGPQVERASVVVARANAGAAGSVALSWTSQRYRNAQPLDIYNATYSVQLGRTAFVTFSASRISNTSEQTQLLAILTIPLGNLTSFTASVQSIRNRDSGGSTLGEALVQRSLPVGQGYGYYLRANTADQGTAGVQYSGPIGRYTLEGYSGPDRQSLRAAATGGIAWIGDSAILAPPIEQSFALVRVGELDGVRILQENQDVGRTRNGRLMLAEISPLNAVKIAVDPLTVSIDTAIDETVKTVVTLPRTGVLIDFEPRRERNALVRLTLPTGAPVPTGATVRIEGRDEVFPVGFGGEAYLTRLADQQSLLILVNGRTCRATLGLDPRGPALADIGPLMCRYGAPSPGATQ